MTDIKDEFLTRGKLADQLGISERTFVRWEKSGLAPPRTVLGKRILYKKETVERWLNRREQKVRAPVAKPPVAKGRSKAPSATGRNRRKPK